jgi:hypothetical protein
MTLDRAQVAEWLRRWSAEAGGATLEFNAEGTCSFTVQDMPIQLTLDLRHQQMLLAAIAIDEDVSCEAGVMRAMLEFSHLGQRSHHCGMSIASTGRPVLWLWQAIAQFDAASFDNTLDSFVTSALHSREVLHAARRPCADQSQGADQPLGMIRA